MDTILQILMLLGLFVVLGVCADVLVTHVRVIAETLKLRLFTLGMVLGAFTTLPELMVGIQAIPRGIVSVSAGNLLGGIMVIFGLVLGISILLHRKIATETGSTLAPSVAFMLLPLILAADGSLSTYDGIIILCFAVILFSYLHTREHRTLGIALTYVRQRSIQTSLLFIACTLAGILIASHAIVQVTVSILSIFSISQFVLGLLVFGIGTNLPEIIITFTSWIKKASDLSVSHLISSALMNIVGLGLLALIAGSVSVVTGAGFAVLSVSLFVTLLLFMHFSKTDASLRTLEGLALVCLYAIFIAGMLITA